MRAPIKAGLAIALLLAIASPSHATTEPSTGIVDCPLIRVHDQLPFAPAGVASCPGVRPGALVETSKGFCTLNFLFHGSDGHRYIGTAGHCILGDPDDPFGGDVGERAWARGTGPIAKDSRGKRIGRFRYAILKEPKDFALIQLDTSVNASPKLCWFGGPTAMTSSRGSMQLLHHYGQGMVTGDVLPARTAYAHTMQDRDHVYAWGAVAPGDSGGPIVTDSGKAVGLIVTLGLHSETLADSGLIGVTRLPPQLARAGYRLQMSFRMLTASLVQQY